MDKKWFNDIQPENFSTENMRLVAEQCGIDTAISLLQKMAGIIIYVPNNGIKHLMTDYIRHNFDGTRDCANRLAIECGVSINHIYNIVSNNTDNEGTKKQLTLFDK